MGPTNVQLSKPLAGSYEILGRWVQPKATYRGTSYRSAQKLIDWIGSTRIVELSLIKLYCQAQLKLSAQLKAELVLFPLDPATHPPQTQTTPTHL